MHSRQESSAPWLIARGISKRFGGNVVLRDVDLKLEPGKVILLRGQNGSGKTTLINILTGNLLPDSGEIALQIGGLQKSFTFPRPWWSRWSVSNGFVPERLVHWGVGRSWQDVRLFASQSLRDNIALAKPGQLGENPFSRIVRLRGSTAEEKKNREEAEDALLSLGLRGRQDASADRISFGEAKRVAILRVVRAGAKILFLDEPLSGLDDEEIQGVLDLLRTLVAKNEVALVIVEHAFNIPAILGLASEVWTLSEGQLSVSEPGDIARELASETADSVRNWLRCIPGSDGILLESELPNCGLLSIARRSSSETSAVLLQVEGLVVSRGRRRVLGWQDDCGKISGVNLTLKEGDIALLQAPNGWGKSTLVETIAGIIPEDRGKIRVSGKALNRAHERARAGTALLRPQGTLFDELTVRENLKLYDCAENVAEVGLRRRVRSLSGGEKQRLAWNLTTKRDAKVLLLDEPFLSLDSEIVPRFLAGLAAATDRAVLLCLPGRREA